MTNTELVLFQDLGRFAEAMRDAVVSNPMFSEQHRQNVANAYIQLNTNIREVEKAIIVSRKVPPTVATNSRSKCPICKALVPVNFMPGTPAQIPIHQAGKEGGDMELCQTWANACAGSAQRYTP